MDKFIGQIFGGGDEGRGQGANYGDNFSHENDDDLRGAAHHAANNADDNSDFFAGILNQLGPKKQQVAQEDIDEDAAIAHHKEFFGPTTSTTPSNSATSTGMGSAAAMQALKLFTNGGSSMTGGGQSTGQSAFIGLAMSQAAKLFDQQASAGNVSSGTSKESAVMKAGEMAMRMYFKSQGDGVGGKFPGAGGGENNLGGLLSMAGKFM